MFQQNAKQSKARNLGIFNARGKYIAFLDADDISIKERLAKQVSFLESNHDIILCGSWFRIMAMGKIIRLPEFHEEIKLHLLRGNCIAHSSVMVRKCSLNELSVIFEISKEPSEDFDLWSRLVMRGQLHNLQEVLLDYRVHNEQLSAKQYAKQKQSSLSTKHSLFGHLDFEFTNQEKEVFDKMLNHGNGISFKDVATFKKMQLKLLASNAENIFEPKGFENEMFYLDKFIVKRCFLDKKEFYPITFVQYLTVKNGLTYKLNIKDQLKLLIKSLTFYKVK